MFVFILVCDFGYVGSSFTSLDFLCLQLFCLVRKVNILDKSSCNYIIFIVLCVACAAAAMQR
jgi:hypothetical protein